jgi:beta-barrel assembly-enhancing protease
VARRAAWGLLLCLTLGVQACVTNAQMVAERQRGLEAQKALDRKDWPRVQTAFQAYVEDRSFRRLPQDEQFKALRSASFAGLNHAEDRSRGYDYLLRLTAMPEADAPDFLYLLQAACFLKHDAECARALVVLAQRWPEQLQTIDQRFVANAVQSVASLPSEKSFEARWALYRAGFKYQWGFEPNTVWNDLTLMLLERNRLKDAVEVSRRIDGTSTLIMMRADRRFDAVVVASPEHFDAEAAAHEELRIVQAAADANPKILSLKIQLAHALGRLRDYAAMLAVTDEVLEEVKSTNYPQRVYTDFTNEYVWLQDYRARALEKLGHIDEAVSQMQAASVFAEDGGKNVSQAINLGELYCHLSRPKEALAAIAHIGNVSDYGAAELEGVRLDAAVQLHDESQIQKSLAILQQHHAVSPHTAEIALLRTGNADVAAGLLIKRLLDSAGRQRALSEVQDFPPAPGASNAPTEEQLWRSLVARNDVQAAIAKVGRVESYRLDMEE